MIGSIGLTVNREKTSIVQVKPDGSESLDFLGYTFRYVCSRLNPGQRYLALRPSKRSVARLRGRIRQLTHKRWGLIPPKGIVRNVNRYLTGWKGYFGKGHRGTVFNKIDFYVSKRLISHLKRRSQKGFRLPEGLTWYELLTNRLGWVRVSGSLPTVERRR